MTSRRFTSRKTYRDDTDYNYVPQPGVVSTEQAIDEEAADPGWGKRQRLEENGTGRNRVYVVSPQPSPAPMSPGAARIATALGHVPKLQLDTILTQVYRVLQGCWAFRGGELTDCLESISQLHPEAINILINFAQFAPHGDATYISPDRSRPSTVVAIAATLNAIEELLDLVNKRQLAEFTVPFTVSFVHANGFLWDSDRNSVPQYIQRFRELGDVCIMADTMLTDAGVPQICRNVGCEAIQGHLCYGRGVSFLFKRDRFPFARKSGELRLDGLVAVAVMLSTRGPQLIHLHVQQMDQFAAGTHVERLMEWLTGLWTSSIATQLSLTGPMRHVFTPLLASVGWRLREGQVAPYGSPSTNRFPSMNSCQAVAFEVLTTPGSNDPFCLEFEEVTQSPTSLAARGSVLRYTM